MPSVHTNIQPLTIEDAGQAGPTLEQVRAQIGAVPNIYATMAHSPAALEGFLAFNGKLAQGRLSAATREQIALTVAGANGCDYCASAHTLLAGNAGVSEAEAQRNLGGRASDDRTAAILAFARQVVTQRGRVDASALDTLRGQGLSEGEIVEVIANVAVNLFTNYFNHIAETEIDFPVVRTDGQRTAA